MKGFCFHTSVSQKLPGEYYHLLQGVTNGWIRTNIDSNSLFPFITKTSRNYFTPKKLFFLQSLKFSENSHNYNTDHRMFGNLEDVVH